VAFKDYALLNTTIRFELKQECQGQKSLFKCCAIDKKVVDFRNLFCFWYNM